MSDNTTTQDDIKLRNYELTVVYSPELSEEKLEASIETVSRYVTGRGGEITETQRWGKRRLAYPIKHFIDGYYILYLFRMKPEDGKELENNLRITEYVLRHLLINAE
ncbi:MAG: 30S ribosomal protein S6 [Dehalococcoidales bacterium]|nr:30S ribosomal protein S6 [Dehalococcoidales bacterium]